MSSQILPSNQLPRCDEHDQHSFIYSVKKQLTERNCTIKTRELVKVQQLKHAITDKMKKCSDRRKHRAKNFRPAADPLPGGAGPPKFNQLEMVTTPTDPVW